LPVVTSATDGRQQTRQLRVEAAQHVGPGVAADTVPVHLLRLDPDLPPPAYAHPGDAGADLRARVDVRLAPGQREVVPTGVAIALPEGFVGLVHPRSGLAARYGLTVVNAPGTVDAGYRGEILVTLLNTDRSDAIVLRRGDRIAQLVVQRVERAGFVEVEVLPESVRGAGGLGSTGGFASSVTAGGAGEPDRVWGQAPDEAGDSPGRGEVS
jgi:dUTP pyrophosphatase